METYKCIPCNKVITKTNKLNHENKEFHINNWLNKDNPSYRTHVSCKRVKNKVNFYNEKVNVRIILMNKKENIEYQIWNAIITRNYYYKHEKTCKTDF